MTSIIVFEKKNSVIKAAIILFLAIIAAYAPIIFLDQSYNKSIPITPEFLDYEGKSTIFAAELDRYADFQIIWPDNKLGTDLYLEGKIPLWNPYIGVGQPLAADSANYIFSPLILGFFLPVQFWDIALLSALWVAGLFTFLFLRNIGLNFTSSIAGGIFYMLSGTFTWWLPGTTITVNAFTPFILYSLEKIIQNKSPKYIVLTSVAFSFGILGGHLESVILQLIFVGSYMFYRIINPILLGYYIKRTRAISSKNTLSSHHDSKRILSWFILAFLGGLGLSSFFIFPVYEFIENGYLEHDTTFGTEHYPQSLPQSFLPYIFGLLNTPWSTAFSGSVMLWGYVGIFALFFSILGVYLSLKDKNNIHRYTPLFFISISIFFMMKIVGLPIINWIGYLPILNLVWFAKYAATIIPLGFAVAAAFGIDLLTRVQVKSKTLIITCIVSLLAVLLLLIPLFPYLLSSDEKFPSYITASDAQIYVAFQILQAALFAFMALLLSLAILKNKSAILGIIPLILLEMSLYVPMGLHPIWMAYKSVVILTGMSIITFLILKPNRFTWYLTDVKKIKFWIIICVLIVTFFGEVLVSELSPYGMMKKYDSFQQDPVTDFLKENIGNYRMFSFDYTLGPNYPIAYKISTIGQLVPYTTQSFYTFIHNFLDQQSIASRLGFEPWTYSYGPMKSIDTFNENKKYFDFLGVKYILTQGYDFGTIASGIPGLTNEFTKIGSNDNSVAQSFISPTNSITGIGVSISTSSLHNKDDIILTLDSIPPDTKYHRESVLHTIINRQFNEFKIMPPLNDVLNKQFYMSLKRPQADDNTLAFVYTNGENHTGFDFAKNKLQSKYYENGILIEKKQMVFTIISDTNVYPVAFKFKNINIHENVDAFPRAFLVNQFQIVDVNKAQDFLLKNPDFNLRHEVILEEKSPDKWVNLIESSGLSENSNAEIVSYDENKVIIHTNTNDASLLILTDVYYPGWKAFVDKTEYPIYRANGLVRAIFIPSGNHTVEFSYVPTSFVMGGTVSLITITFLSGVLIYSKRKEKTC